MIAVAQRQRPIDFATERLVPRSSNRSQLRNPVSIVQVYLTVINLQPLNVKSIGSS